MQVAAAAVVPQPADDTAQDATLHEQFETAHPVATPPVAEPIAGPEAEDTVSSQLVVSGQVASPVDTPDAPQTDDTDYGDHPDAESVAAKLQRIRAVVGQAPAATDGEYAEDQHAPAMPVISDAAIADIADDMPETDAPSEPAQSEITFDAPQTDEDDTSEPEYEAEPATDDDAMLNSLAAKMAAQDDDIANAPAATAPEEYNASDLTALVAQQVAEDPAPAEAKPALRAQVLRLRKQPIEAPEEALQETATADNFDFVADDLDDDADYADEEDIMDAATLDGLDDLDASTAGAATTLSAEDEANLMEELAEVERDFADADDVPMVAEAEAEAEAEIEVDAPKPHNSLPDTDDAMMSNIMDQTDQQLKAAVAATEAAHQLGDETATAAEAEEAFRGDLNDAVRPGKPVRVAKPTSRSARPRPAPLKLVASQRIDTPDAASADEGPVAPRRVAAPVAEVSADTASNFAEFAENMGATALPDLLEAAATYTAFVEGSEDFSRPQIKKKVQLGSGVEFSRKDGLRAFGTLLRQGRISKVQSGQFQISDETRFHPDTMAS